MLGREEQLTRPDGSQIWLLTYKVPLRNPDGEVTGLVGFGLDITERKRAEAALRASEETYRNLFQNAQVGLFRTRIADGKILESNEQLARMFGYDSREEFIAEYATSQNYVDPGTRERMLEQIRRDGYIQNFEARFYRKDRSIFWARYSARLYPEQGWIEGVAEDITEQKLAEQQLRETLADLKRSNADLEQFAYVASHDLQEPLRMVASFVQLLADRYRGRLDADADEFIGYAVDGAKRMQQLILDLLEYSRVGTRGQPLRPTDANAVLAGALWNLELAIQETGAIVTHDPLPVVLADPLQLGQLLQNLIGNAIKFRSSEPPRVHISAREVVEGAATSKVWEFAVRDNGLGIAPEYFEKIFMIFQRLHSREAYPGTGIGLAICKKIVERHGGRIWVESAPGQGSTFYFTLPAVQGQGDAPTAAMTNGHGA